jgi:putative transposase
MHWKKHSAEEIVAKLGQVRLGTLNGSPLSEAIRAVGISEATYFRWRAQYGALEPSQVALIKRLEQENARLRRVLADFEGEGEGVAA